MCEKNLLGSIGQSVQLAQQEYCGSLDRKNALRSGPGCQNWIREYYQKYQGSFLFDNLHGEGVYVISEGKRKTIYNGKFYANNLEGYAEVIYPKGSFEGLFKKHQKFGPGVRTWMDGTQDVGLWIGPDLMRLSCVVQREWIPTLCSSSFSKTRLLKHKKLVPILRETRDKAKEILTELNANEDVLAQSDKLYNIYIRDPESTFFNTTLYDDTFFNVNDCVIDVEESDCTKEQKLNSMCDPCECVDPKELLVLEINQEIQCLNSDLAEIELKIACLEERLASFIKTASAAITTNFKSNNELKALGILETESTEALSKTTNNKKQIEQSSKELNDARDLQNILLHLRRNLERKLTFYKAEKLQNASSTTKPIIVTDLLAWNNEELSIQILKHCFLHRSSEQKINIDIPSILSGKRQCFNAPGEYEQKCVSFLEQCCEGRSYEVSNLFQRYDINPDICDARGNAGILFAAVRDKLHVVKTLVNNGANVDIQNDEGLTPLTACILRYLAVQNKVTDWDNAFISKATTPGKYEDHLWHHRESDTSLNNNGYPSNASPPSVFFTANIDSSLINCDYLKRGTDSEHLLKELRSLVAIQERLKMAQASECFNFQLPYVQTKSSTPQKYLLNTECVVVQKEKVVDTKGKTAKAKSKKGKKEKNRKAKPEIVDVIIDVKENNDDEDGEKLEIIQRTINFLLEAGSDPNIGEVPLPALLLSIFTKNPEIINGILQNKSAPNITTEDSLNALHILASLPPFKESANICGILLLYNVDKNAKTSTDHWEEQKETIIGNYSLSNEIIDEGKTPLHILCMRYDFKYDTNNYLHDLATTLVNNEAKVNHEFYLGHTPLSLAILRGNLGLIRALLETKRVDPNHLLGENMGVPLTVLILKRYVNVLPLQTCIAILDLLVQYFANPFNAIGDIGNALEFMANEHAIENTKAKEKKAKASKGSKKTDKKSKKVSSKMSGKRKKGGRSAQDEINDYLLQISRNTLWKRVQCYAVKYLYDFIDTDLDIDDFVRRMAGMLTPEEAVKYIQLLIHHGKIKCKYITCDKLYVLFELIRAQNAEKEVKPPKTKSSKSSRSQKSKSTKSVTSSSVTNITTTPTTVDLLYTLEIRKLPKDRTKLRIPNPCLDPDKEKYKACFYCCKKQDKDLRLCPECEIVSYCSEECNKADSKQETAHKCALVFYKNDTEEIRAVKLRTKINEVKKIRAKRNEQYKKEMAKLKKYQRRLKVANKLSPHAQFQRDLNKLNEIITEKILDDTNPNQSSSVEDNLTGYGYSNSKNKLSKRLPAGQQAVVIYDSTQKIMRQYLPELEKYNVTKAVKNKINNDSNQQARKIQRNSTIQNINKKNIKAPAGCTSSSSSTSTSTYYSISTSSTKSSQNKKVNTPRPSKTLTKNLKRKIKDVKQVAVSRNNNILKKEHYKCHKEKINSHKQPQKYTTEIKDTIVNQINGSYRRIPSKYQYLLEQISGCFGDLDLSRLFLPYACFSNGQLYYKFSKFRPVFNRNYSSM